jgi:hypothetical protein
MTKKETEYEITSGRKRESKRHTQHDKQKECKQRANSAKQRQEKTYVWAQLAADEANSDSSSD